MAQRSGCGWTAGSPRPCTAWATGLRPSRSPSGPSSQTADPDLRLDLLCTLAKCRMLARPVRRPPGDTARGPCVSRPPGPAPRLLVLAARTHCNDGELDTAVQVAAEALAAGEEAADSWAVGWALSAAAAAAMGRAQYAEAIALLDRGLGVAHGEPTLIDLRLLLLLNKAVTLASLDKHEEAHALASQARAGSLTRLVPPSARLRGTTSSARSCLRQDIGTTRLARC